MYHFIVDFIAQTEAGLKMDIKASGVENIDPWEDMKEDANNIENYLFSNFKVEAINMVYIKINSKYIIRYILKCPQSLISFTKENNEIINHYVKNGWAPYSFKGFSFQISEIVKDEIPKYLNQNIRLKQLMNGKSKVLSFSNR